MFTQCPKCQKTHPLTLEQLRASRGMLRCEGCSETFDALELISETASDETAVNLPSTDLPWSPKNITNGAYWGTGLITGLLLLAGQAVYFEGYAFSQNPIFRPALEKICVHLGCRLPAYKNLDEFTVLQGSFTDLPDHTRLFKTVISNQAAFTQAYPNIDLTLFDYAGKAFAHRVFRPEEYLLKDSTAPAMAADATIEISLKIAAPETKIGGYTFELTY